MFAVFSPDKKKEAHAPFMLLLLIQFMGCCQNSATMPMMPAGMKKNWKA